MCTYQAKVFRPWIQITKIKYMNVSLQHNILCSVRSRIDNTDKKWNLMQKAGIHRLEIWFFYYKLK